MLRRGARDLLVAAVEAEAAQYLADLTALVYADVHRQVMRNGHAPSIVTGVGPRSVQMGVGLGGRYGRRGVNNAAVVACQ